MAIVDVIRAYLLGDMEYYVLVKVSGDAVNIMCDVNNRCTKYIAMDKEKKCTVYEANQGSIWIYTVSHVMVRHF